MDGAQLVGPELGRLVSQAVQTLSQAVRESQQESAWSTFLKTLPTIIIGLSTFIATLQFHRWTRRHREPSPELVRARIEITRPGKGSLGGKRSLEGCAQLVFYNPGDMPLRVLDVFAWLNHDVGWGRHGRYSEERDIPPRSTVEVAFPLSWDVDSLSRALSKTTGQWGIVVGFLGERGLRERTFSSRTNETGAFMTVEEWGAPQDAYGLEVRRRRPSLPVRLGRGLQASWSVARFILRSRCGLHRKMKEVPEKREGA